MELDIFPLVYKTKQKQPVVRVENVSRNMLSTSVVKGQVHVHAQAQRREKIVGRHSRPPDQSRINTPLQKLVVYVSLLCSLFEIVARHYNLRA